MVWWQLYDGQIAMYLFWFGPTIGWLAIMTAACRNFISSPHTLAAVSIVDRTRHPTSTTKSKISNVAVMEKPSWDRELVVEILHNFIPFRTNNNATFAQYNTAGGCVRGPGRHGNARKPATGTKPSSHRPTRMANVESQRLLPLRSLIEKLHSRLWRWLLWLRLLELLNSTDE